MLLFTNSYIDPDKMTPAHDFAGTRDFTTILDNIRSGAIQCGSGTPYPIEWASDTEDEDLYQNPWDNTGFINTNI